MKSTCRPLVLFVLFLVLVPLAHAAGLPAAPAPEASGDRALNLRQSACHYSYGSGIGASDINISPLDGIPEIVLGGGAGGFGDDLYWYILHYDQASGEYRQVFVGPTVEEDDHIARILAGDFVLDEDPEIVIARGSGLVEVWDQRGRRKLGEIQVPVTSELGGLALADADLDGTMDVIVTTIEYYPEVSHLYVYTVTGTLQWELPGAGGMDVVVAQMDADPQLEIAAAEGAVVDSLSRTVQWTFPQLNCRELEAADLDGDTMAELVSADYQDLNIYNVEAEELYGAIENLRPEAVDLFDIDGDGAIEILAAGDQWSEEECYDPVTLELEWMVPNPDSGTTDIRCGDVDLDGEIELIWGAGHSSTGSDHLYIADWSDGTIEWNSEDLRGPWLGPLKGDVTGDGVPEIVAVTTTSDKTRENGVILVFNAADLSLRAVSQPISDWGQRVYDFCLRNVDGDDALEIVISTTEHYDGMIKIYNFFNIGIFSEDWSLAGTLPDSHMTAVEAADVDLDGEMEVLGAAHGHIHVYDYLTGAEEWVSPYTDVSVTDLEVDDTDGDGVPEILALGSYYGEVHVFDGVTKALEAIVPAGGSVMRTVSLFGWMKLITVGNEDGRLITYAWDGSGYALFRHRLLVDGPIDGFTIGPNSLVWISSGGRLSLFNGFGNNLLWTSERYGTTFGDNVELVYPGPRVVTGGSYGIMEFSRPGP